MGNIIPGGTSIADPIPAASDDSAGTQPAPVYYEVNTDVRRGHGYITVRASGQDLPAILAALDAAYIPHSEKEE